MGIDIQPAEARFADALGDLGAELGLNRVVAKIYALLYLRQETLSLETLASELQVSKATISINIRELERWGAVRRVWLDGSRKGFFVANPDVVGVVMAALREGLRRRLTRLEEELRKIPRSEGAGNGSLPDRMVEIGEILALANKGLDALDRPNVKNLMQLAAMYRARPGRPGTSEKDEEEEG